MDGRKLKPSHTVGAGDVLEIVRPDGSRLTLRVTDVPSSRQVSRKDRGNFFTVLEDSG
jgi:ribosomal 50S subunit-recycling heat shock protein